VVLLGAHGVGAEVVVHGEQVQLVQREQVQDGEDLVALEEGEPVVYGVELALLVQLLLVLGEGQALSKRLGAGGTLVVLGQPQAAGVRQTSLMLLRLPAVGEVQAQDGVVLVQGIPVGIRSILSM